MDKSYIYEVSLHLDTMTISYGMAESMLGLERDIQNYITNQIKQARDLELPFIDADGDKHNPFAINGVSVINLTLFNAMERRRRMA